MYQVLLPGPLVRVIRPSQPSEPMILLGQDVPYSSHLCEMSRSKVATPAEPRYKPVDSYTGADPPEWNDVFRGILAAMIENQPQLYNINLSYGKDKVHQFRATKEKILDIISGEISPLLQQKDARMNVWAILEKWCWMVEMYARSVEFKFFWRYQNSMNFLSNAPSSGICLYLGCLTSDRFAELTTKFGTSEEETKAISLNLTKNKTKRFNLGTGLFISEMALYAEICRAAKQSIVVVTTAEGLTPVQIVSPAFTVPSTSSAPEVTKTRRTRQSRMKNKGLEEMPNVSEILTSLASTLTTAASTSSSPPLHFADLPKLESIQVKEEVTEIPPPKEPVSVDYPQEILLPFIEAIKHRPCLWDCEADQNSEKQRLWIQVEESIKAATGTQVKDPYYVWKSLVEFSKSPHPENWPPLEKFQNDVRTKMKFLDKTNGKLAFDQSVGQLLMTAANAGPDIQSQLQKILGFVPPEISPRENQQKRQRIASPGSMREPPNKKSAADATQIVTTWFPPKENDIANAFAAVAASAANPTATAQILSTSTGIPLSGLFTMDHVAASSSKEIKEKKSQVNGISKRHQTSPDSKYETNHGFDKWNLLGRLVEQTCRELESKDMETAVHLQRELSEVLCKYQLQSIKKA